MIARWMLGVLCCHAIAVFDGGVLVGAAHEPPGVPEGVPEVEECLEHVNTTVYNVGPHLVLRNWTVTHTELSVFCRINVTDLYRCIAPYVNTGGELTSAILRTFEHLCDEDQQPGWLDHSACVPYERGSCLAGLNQSVVTLYGVTVHPNKTLEQCRLLKDYVRCVHEDITEACSEGAADWHVGLIRSQWGPYQEINTCDIFDDIVVIPPPPDVAAVQSCNMNYTNSALDNLGLHLVLKKHILTDTQVSGICKTDVSNLYTCLEPYPETTLTGSLTKVFGHLCDEKEQKEWVKYSLCALSDSENTCETDLQEKGAWVTMHEFEVDRDKVIHQCRLMKDYVKCTHEKTKEMCGRAAADWHTGVIRKIWRPYRDIITCDVYGPTGGTVGLVTGIVVGLLLISICGLLIWYNPKKTQTKRQLRASTAL